MPGKRHFSDPYAAWTIGWITLVVVVVVGLAVGLGVGLTVKPSKDTSTETIIILPYVTPPVAGAAPVVFVIDIDTQNHGFQTQFKKKFRTASRHFRTQALDPTSIVDRFFNPAGGPTNLFGILKDVDARIQGINSQMAQTPCRLDNATAYNITTWGQNHTFYAQCSQVFQPGPGSQLYAPYFDQWGIKDGNFYLFEHGGETNVAAIVYNYTANNGTNPDLVRVWYSVGVINRNGSHGVVEIVANPIAGVFEMSVAGGGFGYCGAQLKSNNITINVTGSADMGATCQPTDSVCVSAQDISQTTTCGAFVNTFTLRALGRSSYTIDNTQGATCGAGSCDEGPSQYPSVPNVPLTGNTTDSTFFGPTTPTV